MEHLTEEQFKIATLSEEKIEIKLNQLRETLTPENSRVALCGICRYNDEIENLYRYNCYPFCGCQITPKYKGLMIFYSPDNKDYIYSYARELDLKCTNMIKNIKNYKSTLKWYNYRKKRSADKAIMRIYIYMLKIVDLTANFELRKKSIQNFGPSTIFSYPEPPRNI